MRTKQEIDEICKKILEKYLSTPEKERSLTKLGEKYKIKRQILSNRFKNWGIEIINQQNRKRIDETVFDIIDSEEKAYWLGFLYADGNIGKTEHKLEMNLSAEDSEHMLKFQNFLKYTEDTLRIRKNYGSPNPQVRFSVRSKHIWEALNSKGCTPKKSLTLTFPDEKIFKQKNLIFHFIRGYIDGDGCICIYKDLNSYRTRLSLLGTEAFLEGVLAFLKIPGKIKSKNSKNYENRAFELRFSELNSRKILRLIYEDSTIYLTRKYNKFLECCRLEEESSRRLSSKIGESCDANPEVN